MKIIDTSILSERNTKIPLTIVEADLFPSKLLICAHGFKAKRTEDGRFLEVAKALAPCGVTSVMMGFPGCDESEEDFIDYTLHNCLDDIDSSVAYVRENYDISDKTGMIGYSMGGRLTAIYIKKHPEISCIGLWAGACYDAYNGEDSFLDVKVEEIHAQIKEKGYCDYHNGFDNTDIRLAKELIEQIENDSPVEGLNGFKGAAIVVHGDQDITVPYAVGKQNYDELINASKRKLVTIHKADHGFGQWDGHPELSRQLTENTIEFFKENFL